MADLELEGATVAALEALGLGQLDSLETCDAVIGGDVMDLLDTTELPDAKAWASFGEALEAWREQEAGSEEGSAAEFWSLVSQAWGGDTGTGHRALLALLQLALRSKEPGEERWLAAKMYLWLMDLPGASAYGVFNQAMFRSLLGLLKAWLEGAAAAGAGGGRGEKDKGAAADEEAEFAQEGQAPKQSAKQQAADRRKRAARRGRGSGAADEPEEEEESSSSSEEEDSEDEGGRKGRGGRRGGRAAAAAASKRGRGRGAASAAHKDSGLEELLRALERSLVGGSLGPSLVAHDDVQGELTDLVLGIYAVASASSAGPVVEAARALLMALVTAAGGPGGNPIVLRALMPLLTMKPSRGSGIPQDARTRTAAHQKAVQVLQTLIKEGQEQRRRMAAEGGAKEGEGEGEEGDAMEVDDDEEEGGEGRKTRGQQAAEAAAAAEGEGEKEPDAEAAEEDGAKAGGKKGRKKAAAEVPQDYLTTVLAVLEHMCAEAPDRADVRARLVDSTLGLLEALQGAAPELGPRFIRFLAKLLRSPKVGHRAFGVEIAASFVNAPWAWPASAVAAAEEAAAAAAAGGNGAEAAEGGNDVWQSLVALVESFASRVLDKAPTVRARAMVCLSEMLLSVQEEAAPPGLKEALLELAYPATATTAAPRPPQQQPGADGDEDVPRDLVSLVRSRCQDDKAVVRKAALQALEILLTTGAQRGGRRVTARDVQLFATRCNDVSVLTRKQAMQSLSALLLARPGDLALQETWVKAVLPLVADPEQSILNRLADIIHEVILDRILAWHRLRKSAMGGAAAPAAGSRARRAAASASQAGSAEEQAAEAAAERARNATVWELLAMVAARDLNKCLQQAVGLVLTQASSTSATGSAQTSPRRLKELMEALQSAALASIDGAGAEEGAAEAEQEDRTALRRGAWSLLEAILASDKTASPLASGPGAKPAAATGGAFLPSDPAFVVTCWRRAFEGLRAAGGNAELEDDARKILRVLARIAKDVPGEMGMGLAEELLGCLAGLDERLSPENCGAALETIAALCLAKAPTPEEGAGIIRNACTQVLEACEQVLRAFVVGPREGDMAALVSRLERATFLVGAVAILGFSANEDEIKSTSSAAGSKKKGGKSAGGTATAAGNGPLIRVPVPPAITSLLRVLLLPEIRPLDDAAAGANAYSHTQQVAAAEGGSGGEEAVPVPEQVRALAFLSLGKACLRDKALAKENVNLFVRELAVGASAAIKSNALLILGDLCVRYTSLVERHVPAMARCLQDESALIRRHALALISQLLLQDYLKWRGLLLHRYLAILVDRDPRVAEVAEYMLFTPLLRKCPSLFVNHFVEALVVLNGCVDHDSYKAALSQGAESGTAVTMEGVDFLEGDDAGAAGKRMHIYRAMLQHMTDEQRIQVTAKLTQDILGAATEEDGSEVGGIQIQSYHRASRFAQGQRREALLRKLRRDESLVRDALAVLRCPDIKVAGGRGFGGGSGGGGDGGDDDADALMMEDGQGGASSAEAAAAAKGRLLSKVSRKHLLEHVVPELVSLKACLERAHSPLLRDVMEYLMDLMRAHKDEVKDALSASPTLFHEIEYDLQQFEREREKKAQEEAAAAAAAAEARATMPTASSSEEADADADPPASPTASNAGRRSSVASAASSTGQRRRSSVGSTAGAAAPDSAGAVAGTGPQKKTSRASCSTAPRLRRSSAGAGLSRTPAEAIRAAMQPDESGPVVSQALTPVPLKRRDEDDDEEVDAAPASAAKGKGKGKGKEAEPDENEVPAGTRRTRGGGKKKAAAPAPSRGTRRTRRGAAPAEAQQEEVAMEEGEGEEQEDDGMRVNVTLPKAQKQWKVTAGRSPLDSAASKANVEADEED